MNNWTKNSSGVLVNDDLPGVEINIIKEDYFFIGFPDGTKWCFHTEESLINDKFFLVVLRDTLDSIQKMKEQKMLHEKFKGEMHREILNLC